MARRLPKRSGLSLFILAAFLSITAWFSFSPENDQNAANDGILSVHILDVGQADAILIEQSDSAMLVDAGNNEDTDTVVEYLNARKIKILDYVVGTHPHEDHIGGLDGVIRRYEVDAILMPKITNNTKTFEDVLEAIQHKGLKVTSPKVGQEYALGDAAFTILSPSQKEYEELNEYSIALRLVYKNRSFLLLGDCEKKNEREMLEAHLKLKSDVMKVGHHGSQSSSTSEFIEAVNPQFAVITVGNDNDYDHPSDKVLKRLESSQVEVLRTDLNGTIVFSTDGQKLSVQTAKR